MKAKINLILWYLLPVLCWGKNLSFREENDSSITSLKFIGEYVIPYNFTFKSTTVGGLSGIDYDKTNEIYYLLSDDRSANNPSRFYTAKIVLSKTGIDTVQFLGVHFLLQKNGQPFPSAKEDPTHTEDPESIRYNASSKQIVWTSEGERNVKPNLSILINPSITLAQPDGAYVDTFPVPQNLFMQTTENGPRQNGTLEGVTFDENFEKMYVSLEEPRYEDGPPADVVKTNSWVRIFAYEVATKKNFAQYAYALEPVAHPANPPGAFKINGVDEILWLGKEKLLVMERSFSTGRLACAVKVFIADLHQATHVEGIKSLKENPPVHPVSKKMLLNMDDLGLFIDNLEGMTFGPILPNGHKTILFVSDNNFNPLEKMQFLLFEVIP